MARASADVERGAMTALARPVQDLFVLLLDEAIVARNA
jgi:hypothetical protein